MSTSTQFPPRRPGLLKPLAVRIGAISWMPRLLPQIVLTDRILQGATGGRLTILDVAGLPNMMLTTTGRKSGLPRSTPLLCVPDHERILIAGSYFGGPREPLWVKNLEADPEVTVRYRGRVAPMTARLLTDEERSPAWRTMLEVWPNFARYERRTSRLIKVFELVPRESAGTSTQDQVA